MTPKEKAIELVEKFKFETTESEVLNRIIIGDISVSFKHHKAKQCALICVDEMIDIRNGLYINEGSLAHQWLLDVRQEIEKL
jgi:hypothetical protein